MLHFSTTVTSNIQNISVPLEFAVSHSELNSIPFFEEGWAQILPRLFIKFQSKTAPLTYASFIPELHIAAWQISETGTPHREASEAS